MVRFSSIIAYINENDLNRLLEIRSNELQTYDSCDELELIEIIQNYNSHRCPEMRSEILYFTRLAIKYTRTITSNLLRYLDILDFIGTSMIELIIDGINKMIPMNDDVNIINYYFVLCSIIRDNATSNALVNYVMMSNDETENIITALQLNKCHSDIIRKNCIKSNKSNIIMHGIYHNLEVLVSSFVSERIFKFDFTDYITQLKRTLIFGNLECYESVGYFIPEYILGRISSCNEDISKLDKFATEHDYKYDRIEFELSKLYLKLDKMLNRFDMSVNRNQTYFCLLQRKQYLETILEKLKAVYIDIAHRINNIIECMLTDFNCIIDLIKQLVIQKSVLPSINFFIEYMINIIFSNNDYSLTETEKLRITNKRMHVQTNFISSLKPRIMNSMLEYNVFVCKKIGMKMFLNDCLNFSSIFDMLYFRSNNLSNALFCAKMIITDILNYGIGNIHASDIVKINVTNNLDCVMDTYYLSKLDIVNSMCDLCMIINDGHPVGINIKLYIDDILSVLIDKFLMVKVLNYVKPVIQIKLFQRSIIHSLKDEHGFDNYDHYIVICVD